MNNDFLDDVIDSKEAEDKYFLTRWRSAIVQIAHHYRLNISEQNILITELWSYNLGREKIIKNMARQAGLSLKIDSGKDYIFNTWLFPQVLEMSNGQLAILKSIDSKGNYIISFIEDDGLVSVVGRDDINSKVSRIVTLRPIKTQQDPRSDKYIIPFRKHWAWKIAFPNLKPYYVIILGSFFVNILGLAGITYSMQTYDRIIPAQSIPTMWVLFIGVILAFVFDFLLRIMRYSIIDMLGKRADLIISDRVFGRSLRIKNGYRPKSTGTFISQLRELEQVREMMTSSTVIAIADLPFFFLFLAVIYSLAGIVFLVPLVGMVLMVLPGLLSQKKLSILANSSMRESSLRNAILVETVQGLDDIKYLQAEYRFQQQWLHYTNATADNSIKIKKLTHTLTTWSFFIQNSVFVCVVLVGTPFVMEGKLSTGALVASSILSSRMMAPISQIANILTRWQQTKVAISGIDNIMKLPVDHQEDSRMVHKPAIYGKYKIRDAAFIHNDESTMAAVKIKKLDIKPGERIALLGRNGSGKSSLLSALAGMMLKTNGELILDDINLYNIDPSDVRRDVGYLTQHSRLFYGTIRENLTLGMPLCKDEDLFQAISLTGAINFINQLPDGLDYLLQEGGGGLSGGQQQILLLSRLLLRNPSVILLDEPTAALDELTEDEFVNNMKDWLKGKTVIIATHRKKILELVDRVIVVSNGEMLLDEKKKDVIATL
ncbi:ATP-binding cassette subfamily C protein LapB/adhesin transport system membrane fusion protein [Serratia marcescens]|uniref:ATP-binding cassette subfamily C protein LapB/adhesin transport system membrane fusion protein n=1 Tax=Serratia marcescens TaxID=615 RepID=A0AA46QD85_SERMA|nr:type I secretion system permease/ATPase [Serratia marcescens]TQI86458.1 ATP-binding cassette subfamily C protein LapB/adhesin transport system membrane fusion protein [Serratia marcescens]HEJ7122196.1 type I secretion system permease/ATPase [Serratia marcescens]